MATEVRSVFVRNDRIENINQINTQEILWIGPPDLTGRSGLHCVQPGEIGVYKFEYSGESDRT